MMESKKAQEIHALDKRKITDKRRPHGIQGWPIVVSEGQKVLGQKSQVFISKKAISSQTAILVRVSRVFEQFQILNTFLRRRYAIFTGLDRHATVEGARGFTADVPGIDLEEGIT